MKNGIFEVFEGEKKVGGPFKFSSLIRYDEALAKSDSLDALREKVSSAISDKYRQTTGPDYCYPYIRDLFMDKVVWDMKGSLWQSSYSILDGKVTLGTPTEVQVAYVAITNSASESARVPIAESNVIEDIAESTITMTIIKPGMSKNKRNYSADMLKRDYKVFEGAKMFLNHATDAEEKARPEGRVQDWAATMKKVWVENDGTVKGTAAVIDKKLVEKLDALKASNQLADMGVSIRAVGTGSKEKDGSTVVESLVKCKSVDFVTFAGAGGQVEAMESAQDDVDLLSEAQLREVRPDLVSLIESKVKEEFKAMKTVEELTTELAEATRKLNEANATNEANAKKLRVLEAQGKIAKAIAESGLPKPSQDRLAKQFSEAESDEKIAEAIKDEKKYIESLGGKSKPAKVVNMGESKPPEDDDDDDDEEVKESDMVESFKLLGLDDNTAKIAARGRK